MKSAKTRKCKYCGTKKVIDESVNVQMKWFCDFDHAAKYALDKAQANREREYKAQTKVLKEKLKTRGDYLKEAQVAFNEYIRVRDCNKPCISSGKPLPRQDKLGGGFDAGHYRSVGSAPHLRFCLLNVHGQSKHDNNYLSGNAIEYRKNLINRIGLKWVERIESDQENRKYTIEDLKRIKRIFSARAKLYKRKFR
jgi:hypothetical protein